MITFRQYLSELRFFIRSFEYYAVSLLLLAIIIGLIDAAGISLLYPMITVGFQISGQPLQINQIFSILDNVIPIGSPFIHLGLIFIFLTGLSLLLQFIYWKLAFIFKREIIVKTKKNLFKKVESNDYQYFLDAKQGDTLNLFIQSPTYIEGTYDRLLSLCADLLTSLAVLCMLFIISPIGLFLVVMGGGFFYLIMHIIGVNISEKMGILQIASGQSENKVINEFINGNRAIFSHNASKHWKNQYESALRIYWDVYSESMFIQRIPIIALNSFFYISIGVIILLLYIYYSADFLSVVPVLGTFAAGTMKILPKAMNMGDYKLQLKTYLPHVHIIYEFLHDPRYQKISNGTIPLNKIDTEIRFEDVSFQYHHQHVLNKVSFSICKGGMTALIGPSGSGKSTIVSLLLRLHDPVSGSILLNGKNLKEFDIFSYRDHIGYVSQDPFVFNASVRENITFGMEYSDYEIIEAAKQAHAHDFIMALPQGYDTIVGDLGITLSGGEKQRIVIARAMIRNPELLIFDEATSSLDNYSESVVQKAIDDIARECTTLVIAHRLTTVQKADNIYVLKKGKIVESGDHETLLKNKGEYYELWKAVE